MKKKKHSRTAKALQRIINVRAWIDYDRTRASLKYVTDGIKKLFVPQKPAKTENFQAAVERLNLSDADLKNRQHTLRRLSVFMVAIASLIFIYSGYHLINGHFSAAILSFIVMCLALILAFRYHFWYFQIKSRKLGCTFSEWFHQVIMGGKE